MVDLGRVTYKQLWGNEISSLKLPKYVLLKEYVQGILLKYIGEQLNLPMFTKKQVAGDDDET